MARCVFVCVCACVCECVCVHVCVCIHICIYIFSICLHIRIYNEEVRFLNSMPICLLYACMCVCVCVCTYTHTRTFAPNSEILPDQPSLIEFVAFR